MLFRSPREANSEVPVLLEAICLKAMATRPEDRYRSPRDLAEDIEHWLADEPISASSCWLVFSLSLTRPRGYPPAVCSPGTPGPGEPCVTATATH